MHQHKAFRQKFYLAKYFVGHNFCHFQKISSLLTDIFLSDKVVCYLISICVRRVVVY